ncbi:unnamed protein product [Rotaria socialis]|uniref:Uncharacterized protein n=2 Tax=Rotaria socialis TaxID=392032 RepID=A0A820BM23_9BILA|nr:unnamed protein product [Rotaria socialis]CAF4275863.1 unnamed protein product [Rotaria socialis]CAF4838761.1 unnamed protein product [Rotaria socialis]
MSPLQSAYFLVHHLQAHGLYDMEDNEPIGIFIRKCALDLILMLRLYEIELGNTLTGEIIAQIFIKFKNRFRKFIRLHRIIFNDMIQYKNNDFIYIINMNHDFHVEYFKNIIIKSKRFLSLLSLTCSDKCHMNIDEDSLIEQLDMIENKLNVYNIKLPIYDLSALNYIVYQNKAALIEPVRMFYVFLTSYSNDFSCGTPHRIESLEGGYLFEKEIFGTIKYNFWYDDNCCQLMFDENTWLLSTNNCLFTNDILTKLDNMSKANRKFLRNIPDIQYSGIEYGVNTQPAYE